MAGALDKIADTLKASREGDDETKRRRYAGFLAHALETLPDDVSIEQLTNSDLARNLKRLGIEGASVSNSATANKALYRDHVRRMYDEAGMASVDEWRHEKEGVAEDDSDEVKK